MKRLSSEPERIPKIVALALFSAFGIFMASPVQAAYPLVVDDAGVHPPGEFEGVVFGDFLRLSGSEFLATGASLATGILPGLEGSLGFGYGWLRDRTSEGRTTDDGVLDLTVGLKAPVLTSELTPFNLTLSGRVKVPTASSHTGLGTGESDCDILAIGTWDWEAVSLDLNAGYSWTALGRRANYEGDGCFAGVALRWHVTEQLMLFVETYGALPTDGAFDPAGTVRMGCQVKLSPSVLVGSGIGTGFGPHSAEGLGTIGITVNF